MVFAISVVGLLAQENPIPPNLGIEISPAVGINSKNLEFAPVYYGDGLVFVQAREKGGQSTREDFIDLGIGEPFFELMYADLDPNGLPGRGQSFSPNIRTRFHEGPACFSNSEEKVYFTRSNYRDGRQVTGADGAVYMKIYEADKGLEDWENVRELPFSSDNFSVCHPAVSADGQLIVFASDMPGGYGGMDLYKSEKEGDIWNEPVNLGPQINSKKNEILPSLRSNGFLLFSSDGRKGEGGFDLYLTNIRELLLAEVEPLPGAFNSNRDDLGICISPDGMRGFFSSNRRESAGKDDIFFFQLDQPFLPAQTASVERTLVFLESGEQNPVAQVGAWLFPMGPSGPEGIEAYFDTEILPSAEDESGSILLKMQRKHKAGETAQYTSDQSGRILAQLEPNKDYLLITKATDYRDHEEILKAGLLTSEGDFIVSIDKRITTSEAVIESECITVTGTILSKADESSIASPLLTLENLCTGKITSIQVDNHGVYNYCLPPGCSFIARIEKEGFLPSLSRINPDETKEYLHYLIRERQVTFEKGDVIVLENIYYDFNKSAIQKGAAEELDALVTLMKKHPEMLIELQSHTDARGNDSYNLELAERRGYAAKDYLMARGIDSGRVQVVPRGERDIRNHCKDGVECSESEHQFNRRTEIKILQVNAGEGSDNQR